MVWTTVVTGGFWVCGTGRLARHGSLCHWQPPRHGPTRSFLTDTWRPLGDNPRTSIAQPLLLLSLWLYSFISRAPVTSFEVLSLGALQHTTFIHKINTHYDKSINTAVNGGRWGLIFKAKIRWRFSSFFLRRFSKIRDENIYFRANTFLS